MQGRTQDLELGGAPVAYPGFQRGGCLRSGPIRKVGGGGGGGAVHFRSDIVSSQTQIPNSCGWITSPLRGSGDVIHPQLLGIWVWGRD